MFLCRASSNVTLYNTLKFQQNTLFSLHDRLMLLEKQFTKRPLKINLENELYYATLNHSHYCPVTYETSYGKISLFFFIS
jgi:hypothetical protein